VPMQIELPLEQPTEPAMILTRHPRAKRYVIRLAADGGVRVTIPRWGSKREALAFVAQERAWIQKQQRRLVREREERQEQDRINREHTLDAADRAHWLARARRELPARLLDLAARHGLRVRKVSIRNQKWRWGSCSPSGHICLNWRLVTLPERVRDYVLVHELMHLKRMDHSPKFWKLVEQACPDYRDLRRQLRLSCPF